MKLEDFTAEHEKFGIDVCRRVIFAATDIHKEDFKTMKPALVLLAINQTAKGIFNDELQMRRYRFEEELGI
ncbi:hypothetical protein [Pseudomonas putida]|uniref:hypothetical protein n=1 Tax=Pseudomonas putida TaxID=303 RepID=UPI0023632988|nr:hypothetical protein [Pseudomonas putida]MDD2005087.1 hypothetical protein [Pseudomonas putida]